MSAPNPQNGMTSASAPGAALGYLAQIEYALVLSLQRLRTELEFSVSIESLDDITFFEGVEGDAKDLVQVKHKVSPRASLSDSDTDVWKTISNWIDNSEPSMHLILLTNATAAADSAVSMLRPGGDRNLAIAQSKLHLIAMTSQSVGNKPYFEKFLALGDAEQRQLLSRVSVLDAAAQIDQMDQQFALAVRGVVLPQYRTALVTRLRGWWYTRVINQLVSLANGSIDRIDSSELEGCQIDIAQNLRNEDLPIEFDVMSQPTDAEVDEDDRVFVQQLRLILIGSRRLQQCIYDHNRAYAQRSSWERESLLHVGELRKYDLRLVDEWARHFTPLTDEVLEDELDAAKAARERFFALDTSSLPRIRKYVDSGWIANGSLHLLADELRIGWHPDWLNRLRHLLGPIDSGSIGAA